jgi:hypothetical protein
MDIAIAMAKIDPKYYYKCHSKTYDALVMLDGRPKPTLESLDAAWSNWLNHEGKAAAGQRIEAEAEAQRLKYITPGDGKAMAYQQQRYECQLFNTGITDYGQLPVATALAAKLGVTVPQIIAIWQANISAWLVRGARIEAALAKAKQDLAAMTVNSQADLDGFTVNWGE